MAAMNGSLREFKQLASELQRLDLNDEVNFPNFETHHVGRVRQLSFWASVVLAPRRFKQKKIGDVLLIRRIQ